MQIEAYCAVLGVVRDAIYSRIKIKEAEDIRVHFQLSCVLMLIGEYERVATC